MGDKRWRVAALAGAAVLLAACGQSAANNGGSTRDPGELVFAAVSGENSTSLQQDYQAVINLLQKETGKTMIRLTSLVSPRSIR